MILNIMWYVKIGCLGSLPHLNCCEFVQFCAFPSIKIMFVCVTDRLGYEARVGLQAVWSGLEVDLWVRDKQTLDLQSPTHR